ncbi:MAG: metallophosphoesterase [Clostridia bacterium]|nr:metallophosphoesterase [Clostridia bacterium]
MKKVLLSILIALVAIIAVFAVANRINEQVMYEYIDSFAKVEIENQLEPQLDDEGVPYFVTDGDFKVMQLTDVHICGGILSVGKDKKAINAVAAMITAEKPDLVIVTGDISFAVPWAGTLNNRFAHSMFKRLMENLGVYWTVTLGNHDSEVYNFYDRAAVADMYESEELKYCLFSKGPEDIFGECNHIINLRQSDGLISKSFIMMDSNSYTDEDPLGIKWIYDNIHEDQVDIGTRRKSKSSISTTPRSEAPKL